MEDFDKKFTKALVDKLTEKLKRKLSHKETKAFRRARTGIAYEMMMDYISDDNMTKNQIEQYVESVTNENENTLM